MTTGFWAGGPQAYANALEDQHQYQLQALRERQERCMDPAEQRAIWGEMQRLKAEHRRKLGWTGWCLF